MAKRRRFDPMGKGYDIETARKSGMTRDKTGHMGSREPKSGVILKGRRHPTFGKTQIREELAGYDLKFEEGRYKSQKRRLRSQKRRSWEKK